MNIRKLGESILHVIMFGVGVVALVACAPRESPWEPVPTNYAATMTAVAQATKSVPTQVVSPTGVPTATPSSTTSNTPTTIPSSNASARLNELFTLKPSQSTNVQGAGDTRIIFTNVLEDTRCPTQIDCYQPGRVNVAITVESGGKLAQFDLTTNPPDLRNAGTFNGYVVHLMNVAPVPGRADTRIPLEEYQVTLLVSTESSNVSKPRMGEPFMLKVGQTTDFFDSNVQLTFESVQQDSRCPTRALCATSGSVTLAILFQSEGKTERYTLEAGSRAVAQRAISNRLVYLNALTPYPRQEFASKEITASEYQATFVVTALSNTLITPTARVTPASTVSVGCVDLSRGDASEILGESVKETSAEMFLFQPPNDAIKMRGLCGYASVAFTPNKPTPKNLPSVFPVGTQSDHAIIAGKLTDNKRWEQLVSLAASVYAANPRNGENLYLKLLTSYAAGTWSRDVLNEFPDAARGATNVRVRHIETLGDNALWVWREFDGGRYATLAATKGDALFIVSALTGAQREEQGVLMTMTSVMQKMLK